MSLVLIEGIAEMKRLEKVTKCHLSCMCHSHYNMPQYYFRPLSKLYCTYYFRWSNFEKNRGVSFYTIPSLPSLPLKRGFGGITPAKFVGFTLL